MSSSTCSYFRKPGNLKKCACRQLFRGCQIATSTREKEFLSGDKVGSVISTMKAALEFAPSKSKAGEYSRIMQLYGRTPDIASEFTSYVRLNKTKDIPMKQMTCLLRDATSQHRRNFVEEIAFYAEGHNKYLSRKDILKMLNSADQRKMDWFADAPANDVFRGSSVSSIYDSHSDGSIIYHSFSNARAHKERLQAAGNEAEGPLRFVGYEMSAYSVAKTLVIASMLRRSDEGIVDAILQVWYSSCWSLQTLDLFRQALQGVDRISIQNSDVLSLLDTWAAAEPVTLMEARTDWISKIDTSELSPVLDDVSLPPKFKGGRSRNDSCFHSISSRLLTKRTMEHNGDFVAGAVSVLRTHIQKWNRLVIGKRVSIKIEDPCIVSLSYPSVVDAIRASCPWTMSWNNCLDYMSIEEFHSLARACSAPSDTVHFGYSMNWCTNVQGAYCLTLTGGDHMKTIMEGARQSIDVCYLS
eukprot:gene32672-39501_t